MVTMPQRRRMLEFLINKIEESGLYVTGLANIEQDAIVFGERRSIFSNPRKILLVTNTGDVDNKQRVEFMDLARREGIAVCSVPYKDGRNAYVPLNTADSQSPAIEFGLVARMLGDIRRFGQNVAQESQSSELRRIVTDRPQIVGDILGHVEARRAQRGYYTLTGEVSLNELYQASPEFQQEISNIMERMIHLRDAEKFGYAHKVDKITKRIKKEGRKVPVSAVSVKLTRPEDRQVVAYYQPRTEQEVERIRVYNTFPVRLNYDYVPADKRHSNMVNRDSVIYRLPAEVNTDEKTSFMFSRNSPSLRTFLVPISGRPD